MITLSTHRWIKKVDYWSKRQISTKDQPKANHNQLDTCASTITSARGLTYETPNSWTLNYYQLRARLIQMYTEWKFVRISIIQSVKLVRIIAWTWDQSNRLTLAMNFNHYDHDCEDERDHPFEIHGASWCLAESD